MSNTLLVPPLKCQGIKTKLVSSIKQIAGTRSYSRWIEPFCGSCVVALNVQPRVAILADTNVHIIRLYQEIQRGDITPGAVRSFLNSEGEKLRVQGEPYYYEVRARFNESPTSWDFLLLNRSCFNGIIRFNRKGKFNTPYGHKPERFAKAYVTKITNQVARIAKVIAAADDWKFEVADFRETLSAVNPDDFVYADPPYAGRHVDYFNSWSVEDEDALSRQLAGLKCDFILSTWHSNEFRTNEAIQRAWSGREFQIKTREHFYHVGASENLRHPMTEAFISNFALAEGETLIQSSKQDSLFA
ncbi:MAG TPA: Dam family site-specific DNA-(adenine-N6)-methyltransferase [Edaphobacter sp.]|nr:Dam family site-specific DNA-(adenine-N6)-methyltransferase [Edaphobacter sp.]